MSAACTVHQAEAPSLSGPSEFALSLSMSANPDAISQDGGSQSAIKIAAKGPDGRPLTSLQMRVDMVVNGVVQDFGSLSARSIVTGSDGVASVVYTAPSQDPSTITPTCNSLPGRCVTIIATPTGTDFQASNPQIVVIRLVPPGVILGPASTPTAAFAITPTPLNANVSAQFDASTSCGGPVTGGTCSSNNAITSYVWSFGDRGTATGKIVDHKYESAGTFTVTLTVTNDRGVSASTIKQVDVGAAPPPSLPIAVFTVSPSSPGVNETVFFNASTSTPGAGHTITSYAWTFGDGGTASGVTTSHAYSTAGTYTAQLKVTDEAGQSTTSSGTTITIGSPPSPTSNFTFSPVGPSVGQQVVFDASTSTTSQGQTIVDVAWNFGDGTPVIHCPGDPSCVTANGTNRISAHTYAFAATFVVNLVVTDSAGRTGSKAQQIIVGRPGPTAVLNLFKSGGNTIQADGSGSTTIGSATIVSYRFIWGDATPDTVGAASSVPHTYAAPGPHTVTLVVTDSASLTSSTSKDITTP
jgi:PKD repeat protein